MFRKKKNPHTAEQILSTPVVKLPDGKHQLLWSELIHGTGVFGSSSAGKTSGVGASLMRDILEDQYKPGMMILCVKNTEKDRCLKLATEVGRLNDVLVISTENDFTINALEHELFVNGRQNVNYDHAVDLLMELATIAENYEAGGASGKGSDDRYWSTSMKLRIKYLLMLLVLSDQKVTIANMRKLMIDGFSEEDLGHYISLWEGIEGDDEKLSQECSLTYKQWCKTNYFLHCFDQANSNLELSEEELSHLHLVSDYFLKEYPFISSKTRSIVDSSITGLFQYFSTGVLKKFFDDTMSPEVKPEVITKEGKIIIVDFSLSIHGISSVIAMGIYKKLFQMCQQRRRVDQEESPRPVVAWVDEYHLVVNATSDIRFQSICRETLTACVYISQSIPSIQVAMGQNGETKIKTMLANLGTLYACRNVCKDTNLFFSETIGKALIKTNGMSMDSNDRTSKSTSEQMLYIVPPEHYHTLRSGGKINNYKVDCILLVGGKIWSTGENFLECTFDQRGARLGTLSTILSNFNSLFR